MATIFDEEKEDFKEIVKATSIKLYDKNQDLRPSSQLYLGSCYHPDCDYESCDIQSLSYLSEDYRELLSLLTEMSSWGISGWADFQGG